MHTYSVDKDLRAKVVVVIFGLSMIMSLLFNKYCAGIIDAIVNFLKSSDIKAIVELLEWWGVGPNFLGVPIWYAIFTKIYDLWLWKCWPISRWHGIPDLNGEWKGTLESSFDDNKIPMKMQVNQTWKKISFRCRFKDTKSSSYSSVAAIHVDGNNGTEIHFNFRNNSKSVKDRLQSYDGYNIMELIDGDTIEARYFNNRDNPNPACKGGNKGSFELKRVKKTKKSKQK